MEGSGEASASWLVVGDNPDLVYIRKIGAGGFGDVHEVYPE